MASFTTVLDELVLRVPAKDEVVDVAISGTYNMVILFQKEQGSPGSGSWHTIQTFNTEDATEAFQYLTKVEDERLRLVVLTDTSGTATVTLTAPGDINVTSAAVQITREKHAGKTVRFNKADGVTATMPNAIGSGDVYTFFVETTITSVGAIIQAASANDVFQGGVAISTDIAGVTMLAGTTTDTITMNGTTTGGLSGSFVKLTDIAEGIFLVEGFLNSSGAEATPFSAAV
jgi:hypothetical protein